MAYQRSSQRYDSAPNGYGDALTRPRPSSGRRSLDFDDSEDLKTSYRRHEYTPQRTVTRRSSQWPPQPTCEDENTSLLREADGRQRLKELAEQEIPSRGSADQDSIIEDVPGWTNKDDRRFVLSGEGIPRTSPKQDEKAKRTRNRPLGLALNLNTVIPEMVGRTASPYTYTPTPDRMSRNITREQTYPLPTPLKSGLHVPQPRFAASRSAPSSPTGQTHPTDKANVCDDYFTTGRSPEIGRRRDDERSPVAAASRFGSQSSNTPGSSAQRLAQGAHRADSIDRASFRPISQDNALPPSRGDARRQGTVTNGPPPLTKTFSDTSHLSADAVPSGPQSGSRSRPGSRNVSPGSPSQSILPSPQRSPRTSMDARDSRHGSPAASQPGSRPVSRPSSPSLHKQGESIRLPTTELEWSRAMNAGKQSRPLSRLSSSMTQQDGSRVSMPRMPPMPLPPSLPASTEPLQNPGGIAKQNVLPYPLDDGPPGIFPAFPPFDSREEPAFSDSRPALQPAFVPVLQSASKPVPTDINGVQLPQAGPLRILRPAMVSRHSTSELTALQTQPPSKLRTNALDSPRISSPLTPQTRRLIRNLSKKPLPNCKRTTPGCGEDDWYTLIGAPALQFCPECFDTVFEGTIYRPLFRLSPPHPPSVGICCALGADPWVQLAWTLTLMQQRADLNLMKGVVDAQHDVSPCPDMRFAGCKWYTLCDLDNRYVRDFYVCPADVQKITFLLPGVARLFVPLPKNYCERKQLCSLRASGNRFAPYIDTLVAMHDRADSPRGPNPMSLIELVEERTRVPECPRDDLQGTHRRWHFHRDLPHFTICEDCFESVVIPLKNEHRRSTVLGSFSSRSKTAPSLSASGSAASSDREDSDSDHTSDDGSRSCQLYSARMRRALKNAVLDDDLTKLESKSRKRYRAERRLRQHILYLRKRGERLDSGRRISGVDPLKEKRRLQEEEARLAEEWVKDWE